jgi:predicted nucleic-acid-binding Zn-ribbon protein
MAGFFAGFKRGLRGAKDALGPGKYSAGGKSVACPHCGHDTFKEGSVLLGTRGMAFADAMWANKSATTLACTACGYIQWFLERPEWLGPAQKPR